MLGLAVELYQQWRVRIHHKGTLSRIREHGWTANYVYEPGDDSHRDFAYTIGFSDFSAPELITFDLPPEIANHVFWEAFNLIKSGERLPHGYKYAVPDPEAQGFECVFLDAEHPDTWDKYIFEAICYATEQGRTDRPKAMQIVWPSAENLLYPWQPGCPQTVIDSQPQLYGKLPE
jgi:hypothetical protein